jgi:uncharacterized protein (DUF1330 family)
MPVFVIADIKITDSAMFQEYRKVAGPTVRQYGGRIVAASPNAETVEGDWYPNELVIAEFETMEQAKQWYESEEYRDPKVMREKSSVTNLVFVPGL